MTRALCVAALVASALLLAALLASRLGGRSGERAAAAPTPVGADATVAVWEAEGAGIRARLEPLHPEPRRQAWDAARLRERFGLSAGEPWRLVVEGEEARGTTPAPVVDGAPLLALEALLAKGLAEGLAGESRSLDPLRSLLRSTVSTAEGARVALWWGPAPRSEASLRLSGKTGPDPASLPLTRGERPCADLDRSPFTLPASGASSPTPDRAR